MALQRRRQQDSDIFNLRPEEAKTRRPEYQRTDVPRSKHESDIFNTKPDPHQISKPPVSSRQSQFEQSRQSVYEQPKPSQFEQPSGYDRHYSYDDYPDNYSNHNGNSRMYVDVDDYPAEPMARQDSLDRFAMESRGAAGQGTSSNMTSPRSLAPKSRNPIAYDPEPLKAPPARPPPSSIISHENSANTPARRALRHGECAPDRLPGTYDGSGRRTPADLSGMALTSASPTFEHAPFATDQQSAHYNRAGAYAAPDPRQLRELQDQRGAGMSTKGVKKVGNTLAAIDDVVDGKTGRKILRPGQPSSFDPELPKEEKPSTPAIEENMAGPLPNSNWIVPGKILCGGAPRREDLSTLDRAGVNLFVCLMEKPEMRRLRVEYVDYLPASLVLRFPIQDGNTPSDRDLKSLISKLLEEHYAGKVMYIHCFGGHGRTGLITSILLGLLKEIPAMEAMKLNQRYHSCRSVEPQTSSPAEHAQRMQVHRMLQ